MDEDKTTPEFDLLENTLEEEFGDPTPDSPTEPAEEPAEEPADTPVDEPAEEAKEEEAPAEDPEVPEEKQEEAPAEDEPEEKPATAEDIRKALREMEMERQAQQQTRQSLRSEVRNALYPDGIEKPLLDSEGNEIKGVQDIAGRLLNPATNEVFTYEEARDWLETKRRELDKEVEIAEQNIDAIAEVNQDLQEGERIVMAKYGELLKTLPDVAKEAYESYLATVKVDPKTGLAVEAPINVVRYYDTIMRPYLSVAKQMQLQKQAEEEKAARIKAEAAQKDRADILPNADPNPKDNKDLLDKAFEEYFNQ